MATTSPSDDARDIGRRFLTSSVLGALNTANARRPFSRLGRASVLAFAAGWPTSEAPLHAMGWQALATAAYIRRGALKTPAGWVGLGITAASWAGLYKIWQQANEAGAVYDEALQHDLRDELQAVIDADLPDLPVRVDPLHIIGGPVMPWRRTYVQHEPLRYGPAGRRNQLDIWRRHDLPKDGKAPVIIQVHGGAWVIGNKDQQALPLMAHLAEAGWVCVAINYRLSPRATWPDHIVDVKQAIAWVKEHIAEYGGDPDYVAITGGSAGGHLSSLAALTPNEPEFQPGFEDADTSLVAAVPFYGVYDWTNRDGTGRKDMDEMLSWFVLKTSREQSPELWDHASTMSWVNEDAPPFFVIHGENDSLAPVEQARSFVSRLRTVSKQPVVYAELPGAQHAFEVFQSPRATFTADAVHRFLEAVRLRDGQQERAGA